MYCTSGKTIQKQHVEKQETRHLAETNPLRAVTGIKDLNRSSKNGKTAVSDGKQKGRIYGYLASNEIWGFKVEERFKTVL